MSLKGSLLILFKEHRSSAFKWCWGYQRRLHRNSDYLSLTVWNRLILFMIPRHDDTSERQTLWDRNDSPIYSPLLLFPLRSRQVRSPCSSDSFLCHTQKDRARSLLARVQHAHGYNTRTDTLGIPETLICKSLQGAHTRWNYIGRKNGRASELLFFRTPASACKREDALEHGNNVTKFHLPRASQGTLISRVTLRRQKVTARSVGRSSESRIWWSCC